MTEGQPPESGGENNLSARREHEQQAGQAVLRLVQTGESVPDHLQPELPTVPDLTVDEEMASIIMRRRWRAIVSAESITADGVNVHQGLRRLFRERLKGREPYTAFYKDHVTVSFGVLDDNPPSWHEAQSVGAYLVAAVDPIRRREPRVGIVYVDTSDLDPRLPEDRRTLR